MMMETPVVTGPNPPVPVADGMFVEASGNVELEAALEQTKSLLATIDYDHEIRTISAANCNNGNTAWDRSYRD